MRKFLIILCLIVGIPSIIFIGDSYFKSELENPFRVAKYFAYWYMLKDSKSMKRWADENIYKKIDDLQYSTPIIDVDNDPPPPFADDIWQCFELVSCRKLGSTLVCIYAYDTYDYENLPYFYSVVLTPVGPHSLWERFKDFLYYQVPFGKYFIGMADIKQRWLAVDFFTNDDFQKYMDAFEEDVEKMRKKEFDWERFKKKFEFEQIEMMLERTRNFEGKWSEREKIKQNEEMKKLYGDYLKYLGSGS